MFVLESAFKAVDLTHMLDEKVPTWTGSCGFNHTIKMDYDQGVRVLNYKCHAGAGTHMDAPAHFFREGAAMADIPLDQLIVPLRVINVRTKKSPDLLIRPDAILEHEKAWGKIEANALVLADTGWGEYWGNPDRYRNLDSEGKMHFPGFHVEAAELLLKREIAGIGIDTLSPDGANNKPGNKFPVHEAILGAGKYIIENVANLSKVPEKGAIAIALPLKISIGAEAPMRLIALIPRLL